VSVVYVVFCRLLELVVLLSRGERSKELEILVLRHELSSFAGRSASLGSSHTTGSCLRP
jgi:hypothetical protein